MKTRLSITVFMMFVLATVSAQDNSSVYDYYNSKIDEAVAMAGEAIQNEGQDDVNPAYAKLFVSPVLYKSVLKEAFSGEGEDVAKSDPTLEMEEERSNVINDVLLDVYREAPGVVSMTEDDLLNEKRHNLKRVNIAAPEFKFDALKMPDNVDGGMKTTVTKPKYWSTAGKIALTFTQNYLSPNWFQGGENAQAMLAEFDFDLNYDDQSRITFKNHFDFDLGFSTTTADTCHSFKTNTDRLRIESTFGYKLVKNLDVAAKMKLETQSLPYYPVNQKNFTSNFFAPFDANASIGLNYKPSIGNFNFEIYVAPLSAFNYKYVRFSDIALNYGIEAGRKYKMDYGTQVVITIPTVRIFKIVDFWTRAEYYTDYHRAFFQWETKFDLALTKYFRASLMLHARFDDSAPGLKDENFGYWQFKELMTFGVSYAW
jgi:hypothetical protein